MQANHFRSAAEQITRHEITHKKIANGEIDVSEVKKRIAENYDVDEIAAKYAEAYKGSGMTVEEAFEEIICDAEAGMNVFEEARKSAEEVRQYGEVLSETKQAAEESEPRAPPTGEDIAFSRQMREFPYKSQANELATRWAHKESIHTEDKALVSFHNSWYIIEKFDSALLGYQITEKVSKSKINKIYEENKNYERNSERPSAGRKIAFLTSLDGGRHWNVGGEQDSYSVSNEHRGEDRKIPAMGQTENKESENIGDRGRDNAPSSGNRSGNKIKASREITPEEDARFSQEIDNAEENILYARKNKNTRELSAQRRAVPKVKVSDVSMVEDTVKSAVTTTRSIISDKSKIVNREKADLVGNQQV